MFHFQMLSNHNAQLETAMQKFGQLLNIWVKC
jgi:hypothetical protein